MIARESHCMDIIAVGLALAAIDAVTAAGALVSGGPIRRALIIVLVGVGALLAGSPLLAQHQHGGAGTPPPDARQAVPFPADMRARTLANMRDHLLALQQIQATLAAGNFDKASEIAEQRLGMTSLKLHGASDIAPFMPQAMQDIGTEMHRAASRLAIEATNAGVSGDVRGALAALSKVTAQCVACHTAYRVQ
jgi:hypothetical protein